MLDIIEQASTGRILEYEPAAKATRIVVKGLSFASGVALSSDEQIMFVAETSKYRVWKFPRCGQRRRAEQGRFAIAGERPVRQPARLSRQPDARPRGTHLPRLLRTAQPGCSANGAHAMKAFSHGLDLEEASIAKRLLRRR